MSPLYLQREWEMDEESVVHQNQQLEDIKQL